MEDAVTGAVAGGASRGAHGPHIYPLYVTTTEPSIEPVGGVGPGVHPTLHFLDEPGPGRAVQDPFPGWGPVQPPPGPRTPFEREGGSSGP